MSITNISESRSNIISFEDWLSETRGTSIHPSDIDMIKMRLPNTHVAKRVLLKEIKNVLSELKLAYNPFRVMDILLGDILDISDEIADSVCRYYNTVSQKDPETILVFPYVYIYNRFMYQNHPDHVMEHNITSDKLKSFDTIWEKLFDE